MKTSFPCFLLFTVVVLVIAAPATIAVQPLTRNDDDTPRKLSFVKTASLSAATNEEGYSSPFDSSVAEASEERTGRREPPPLQEVQEYYEEYEPQQYDSYDAGGRYDAGGAGAGSIRGQEVGGYYDAGISSESRIPEDYVVEPAVKKGYSSNPNSDCSPSEGKLTIMLRTNQFGNNMSLKIYPKSEQSNVVLEDDEFESNTSYMPFDNAFCFDRDVCYVLEFKDSSGNGFIDAGYLLAKVNGEANIFIPTDEEFTSKTFEFGSCA